MKKTALWISYDGRSSEEFNVMQVNFDKTVFHNETLIPSRSVNKVQRQNSSIVDFYSVTNSPLSFTINLVFDGDITDDDKIAIIQWLKKDTYKPLSFSTTPGDIYYAIATSIDITHNTLRKGYFSVNFECNAPWGFTKVLSTGLKEVIEEENFSLRSDSVFNTQIVKVKVKTLNTGNLLILNKTNNTELSFIDLNANLNIVIDCLNHSINTINDLEENVLINENKDNYKWLELSPGNNDIQVIGNCEVEILWQGIRI